VSVQQLSQSMRVAAGRIAKWQKMANAGLEGSGRDEEYFPAGGCCDWVHTLPATMRALERRGYLTVTVAPCPKCGGRGRGVVTVARGDFAPDAVSRLGRLDR